MRLNPALSAFVCSSCAVRVIPQSLSRPVGLCPSCGLPMIAAYADGAAASVPAAPKGGIWRWSSLLPVVDVPPGYADDVGDTPVVLAPGLGDPLGVEMLIKREGANPSGSFKDRGLAVGIALGAALGAKRFCLPTQGNAGVAAALFSSRLGLAPCLVVMPESWRGSTYHRACTLFGGEVRFAGRNVAEAGRAMRAECAGELGSGELVDISTFFEPGRLEGKKTMGLEIAEGLADHMPDWIVYPTGGGTGLVGIWKAFAELSGAGRLATDGLPRLAAVQAAGCAPIVESFRSGRDHVEPVTSHGTVADGLDVPGTIMGHSILTALRDSRGTAVAVGEDEIMRAFGDSGRVGVPTSLEGAAAIAAVRSLRRDGLVAPGDRVLVLSTASHLTHAGQVTV